MGDTPEPGHDPKLDRIWTIPNVISVVRLACLPLFLWLLFGKEDRATAAWLLAALGTTDFADGYIARHFDQVSNLGKVLDPVADRLIFIVGGGAILVDGSVPRWFAITVLSRELLVGGATLVLGAMGVRRIDVTWFGKAGTFGLLMAFPLFLAHESSLRWWQGWAWLTGIPGLALSLYAAVLYVPIARRALAENRLDAERVGSGEPG
ncbi:MAG: CDP-alcohol phosphatidyltransferase family protein [Actinomycetota bacterium]|nr:CDP-alcohol phosphatidyltransferase family protein [Acidimicrobiia bacterium]MDQ3293021.1 CDP-alcohol phosphatidyltransferase family protein [Actinomycetota bacterium]